jgi:hypothetical protein
MTEDHRHDPETGAVVALTESAEHVAETEVVASAEVEVARIQAERDIALAKIAAREIPRDLEAELAAALAENELLRAAKMPAPDAEVDAPEVADAPVVVVNDVPAEPADAPTDLPERDDERPAPRERKRDGWFGDR